MVEKKKRRSLGYETKHCMWLMQWAHRMAPTIPELDLLFHVPNEGKRSRAAAGIAKAMGLKKGVLDYFLPVFMGEDAHGLWIEMKKPNESLTPEQRHWRDKMLDQHFHVATCYSWPEAANSILEYLGRKERV